MSIITAGIITRPGSGGKNLRQEMVSIPTHDYLYTNKPAILKTHPHSQDWQFTNFPEVTFTNLAMICVTELRVTGRNAKCAHYFWDQHLDSLSLAPSISRGSCDPLVMQLATFVFLISLAWNYITKSLIHVLQSPVQQGDPYLWQQQKKLKQSFGWFKCQRLNPVIN